MKIIAVIFALWNSSPDHADYTELRRHRVHAPKAARLTDGDFCRRCRVSVSGEIVKVK
jgi:hypothetical protein